MPRPSRRTATSGLLWEALTPAIRWPLHSPRRLAALLVGLVVLIWLFAAVRPSPGAPPSPTSAATSAQAPGVSATVNSSSSASRPVVSETSSITPPAPVATVAPSAPLVEVAVRFVTGWARPDLPAEAWQAELIPLATPAFAAQLRTVVPGNVPARSVNGNPAVGSLSQLQAEVTVPTDAGPVLVALASMGSAWKVSSVTPAGGPATRTPGAGSSLAATYTPLPTLG